ncbi:MAG: peptidoglycan-binding protein [Patescibacteria group bacterium]
MRNDLLWLAAFAGCVSSITIFLIGGGASSLDRSLSWVSREAGSAAAFFVTSITATQIKNDYHSNTTGSVTDTPPANAAVRKVGILIVPGHQPTSGGTEFNGVYERNVVVDLAEELGALLAQNPHYSVMVARTKETWHPTLQNYFDTQADAIETFRQSLREQMKDHIAAGTILPAADQVYHNKTPLEGALQLYGINKWAGEQGYDITLHLHLNDDAERRARRAGEYSGFAVYVPDRQYSNAEASKAIGVALAARLNTFHATSTLPKEDRGVVEDQQLIAVGSNNSASSAALLIEYGYIYEPQFQNREVRAIAVRDYAYQTYLGLQDFFNDTPSTAPGSLAYPYDWSEVTAKKGEKGADVYALQAALRSLGFYPPAGKSFSDCPISGVVGACTRSALEAYQAAHGFGVTGFVGPATRAALTAEVGGARDIFKPI